MTRFLLSLDDAVNVIFAALRRAHRGETYIPIIPSARVTDIADLLIGDRKIEVIITGIRPGEKVHEILVSEEECHRTVQRGKYYVIKSILPEIQSGAKEPIALSSEFSSAATLMDKEELRALLTTQRLFVDELGETKEELLR